MFAIALQITACIHLIVYVFGFWKLAASDFKSHCFLASTAQDMAKREVSEIWGIWEFDRRFWEGDIEYKFRRLNSWRCDVPALPEIAEDVYFAPAEDLEQEAEAQPHDPVQEAAGHTMEVEDIPMQ